LSTWLCRRSKLISPLCGLIQWIVNAYTLCLSALLLVGGAAGDQFGRRRLFVIGLAIFAAASLWCGLSPDIKQLIAARAVQGLGAALLVPSSLALIGATFDESERGKAIGTWAGFSALAAASGPLLGGWIVDHFSWRWIFLSIRCSRCQRSGWFTYEYRNRGIGRKVRARLARDNPRIGELGQSRLWS
jgi:MFS family permease